MAMSKVFSFFSGANGQNPAFAGIPSLQTLALTAPQNTRLRDALKETAPSDGLMGQLRDIIMGPQVRLNEARFDEMLDILEEQKSGQDRRLDFAEQHLRDSTAHVTRITSVLEGQDEEISFLKKKFDDQMQALRTEQTDFFQELRDTMDKSMDDLTESLKMRMEGIEIDLRGEVLELSGMFVKHVENDELRWEDERNHSLKTLEQRIAQWRAEIEDTRRSDMESLATSMMEVGRRLMALQEPEGR